MLHRSLRALIGYAVCSIWLIQVGTLATAAEETRTSLRLARFSADVTIPLDHRCMGVLPTKSKEIVDPLFAHGWVLLGAGRPVVCVAFDWCEIRNQSFDRWRQVLAEAVGTTPERVFVSSLHQHDAPVIDEGAQLLLDQRGLHDELFSMAFHDDCLLRLGQAASDALDTAQPVTHIGLGKAIVAGVASNRRVQHLDGRIDYDRYSASGGDSFHQVAEGGLIDPYLQTISFWNEETPLIAMHHYAVHPMSFYGRGGVSADFVGLAREQWRRETGVAAMYVTGCAGDTTAGKYNDASQSSRERLTATLVEAMHRSWAHTVRERVDDYQFQHVKVRLPFHEGDQFGVEALTRELDDATRTVEQRIMSAMSLNSRLRWEGGAEIDVPCLTIGSARVVLLPGETFVGYQVMAQQMRPEDAVFAIGYGESWTGYIPTAVAFDERFNHDWRWAGPGSEAILKQALAKVLVPTTDSQDWSGQWQQILLSTELRERCEAIIGAVPGTDPLRSDHQVAMLLRELDAASSLVKRKAAWNLFDAGRVGDGRKLRHLLAAGDARLRVAAAAALARCGNRQALEIVRAELNADNVEVRREATEVLARLGAAADVDLLEGQLLDEDPLVIVAAHWGLARIAGQGDRPLWERLAHDDSAAVRDVTARALGELRITGTSTLLIELLDDQTPAVGVTAARGLLAWNDDVSDGEKEINRLVYQADAQHPRYTEGSVVELADGSLCFAVTQFIEGDSDFAAARIVARNSQDGGHTWSEPRVLQENVGQLNVMSVSLRRLTSGDTTESPIGLFYLVKNAGDSLDLYLRISHDELQTLGTPIKINDRNGYHVMNNDRVLRLSGGRLLAPVAYTSDIHRDNHFISYCYYSDDQGLTWQRGTGFVDQPLRGAMEPDVVELSDGRVMMIVRTQRGKIAAAYSSDGGNTWGEPFDLNVVAPESPATIRAIPATGNLLLLWNDTYVAGQSHGGNRSPLSWAISRDDGLTWEKLGDLETKPDHSYAYTSMIFQGTKVVMTYWDQDQRSGYYSCRYRSMSVPH